MHGAIEHLVDRTQVFPDLVDLADDVSQKLQIRIGVTDEVMHRHVAGLAVAVQAAVALLQP